MKLSIIMPAYNEEGRLPQTLEAVSDYCGKFLYDYEVIVVDDASSDRTSKVASSYGRKVKVLRLEGRRGKGYSFKKGVESAVFSDVLLCDADLPVGLHEVRKLFAQASKGFDVAIGSRALGTASGQKFQRKVSSKAFNAAVKFLGLGGFGDTQCGFKLFSNGCAKKLVGLQTIDGFSFDVELLCIASRMGLKVKEVPVQWVDKPGGKLRLAGDSLQMLRELLQVKLNALRGAYG